MLFFWMMAPIVLTTSVLEADRDDERQPMHSFVR